MASLLGLFAAIASFVVSRRGGPAAEDAAILFRYSENLANGFGVVYNPGGDRVDGATDMPFMAGIAALYRLGFATLDGAALLNAFGAGVMVALVYLAWLRWSGLGAALSLAPVVLLVVGPMWLYGLAGFGTIFFAATCTAVAVAAEAAIRRPDTARLVLLGSTVALCGLARPEGFLLGGAIVAAQGIRVHSWRLVLIPLAVVLPVGLLWVAWRWSYFGYPLPNPFYKKGGGQLYTSGLETSLRNTVRLALPFLVVPFAALWIRPARRLAITIFGITAFWAGIWILLSDEMNYFGRFQFAIAPVIAVLSAPLVQPVISAIVEKRRSTRRGLQGALVAALSIMLIASAWDFGRPARWQFVNAASNIDIHPAVADVLKAARTAEPRALATSEAGHVAWNSGWTVTDLWGLNEKSIAHEGFLKPAQLQELRPAVIFSHICASNGTASEVPGERPCIANWDQMTDPLQCFIADQDYELSALWVDSPNHSWAVWVDPEVVDYRELRDAFASMPAGVVPLTGLPRVNSANTAPLPLPTNCGTFT